FIFLNNDNAPYDLYHGITGPQYSTHEIVINRKTSALSHPYGGMFLQLINCMVFSGYDSI
ncbi:hypothetical protein, partial [Klebsiella pneumoniae]|uniref:hypothetical protein n=1 Tax=Klebsiella pneumoniae TaxID=573 RepID=UPI001A7E6BBF